MNRKATKHFTASRGWYHRFRNRFNLKNIKIVGEAALVDEEATATFLAELKKNYQGKIRSQASFQLQRNRPVLEENAQQDLYSQKCNTSARI